MVEVSGASLRLIIVVVVGEVGVSAIRLFGGALGHHVSLLAWEAWQFGFDGCVASRCWVFLVVVLLACRTRIERRRQWWLRPTCTLSLY